MKQIDNYISEKLHIGKQLKKEVWPVEPGERFMIMSVYDGAPVCDLFGTLEFKKLVKNDDNDYTIEYYSHDTLANIERSVYVNDKGYLQKSDSETNGYIKSIFLSKYDAYDFLSKFKPKQNIVNILKNYYDSKNESMLDKKGEISFPAMNIEQVKKDLSK